MTFKRSPALHLAWVAVLYLVSPTMGAFWSKPQESVGVDDDLNSQSSDIIILGAGVIGLSTAYYLALAQRETAHPSWSSVRVTVIEASKRVCPGASSHATGGLGDFGFSPTTTPLGVLSYALHQDMAAKFNGRDQYGFSPLSVFRVTPENFTGDPTPPDDWGPAPPVDARFSDLPPWISQSDDWAAQNLASPPHGAHLDPAKFCHFLYNRCKDLGVTFVLGSNVTSLETHKGAQRFTSAIVRSHNGCFRKIACQAIVVAAGPWSDRVFTRLFPKAEIKLPMNATTSAGNHFRVSTPGWKPSDDERGSEQVFLGNVVPGNHKLDITSFLRGSLYVGGYGAIPEKLPEFADSIEAQMSEIEAMVGLTRRYLKLGHDEKLEVYDIGRCYRPLATPNRPIITKADWSLLGLETVSDATPMIDQSITAQSIGSNCLSSFAGGLYFNTAHNSDGITLSLGSGKVMSELILGLQPSIDLSGFGLSH